MIDYKKTDEMMGKLDLDPIQFHLLLLLYHRDDAGSSTAQLERLKYQVLEYEDKNTLRARIDDLVERGFLENFNLTDTEGKKLAYNVDKFVVTSYFISQLIAVDCGEELWKNYPAAFPLSSGEKFLARTGDKDFIIQTYERKIRKDLGKHKFVLQQLDKFKKMVAAGKINGMKIQNFVDSELWDTLGELNENDSVISNHGESI